MDDVNKLAFTGTWPDLEPLRLRLQGIDEGAAPAQPDCAEIARAKRSSCAAVQSVALPIFECPMIATRLWSMSASVSR